MKTMMKQNEPIILASIGIVTVCLLLGGVYLVWTRPRFLYMPIYEAYEKDSDIETEDIETEMTQYCDSLSSLTCKSKINNLL